MHKFLMKRAVRKAAEGRLDRLTPRDVAAARSVLFAVFSRYGDAIISFKVMREFMDEHPEKKYFVVTSNQLEPYAARMLGKDCRVFALDKRKNPLKLVSVTRALKREHVDLGLNPFSLGDDSEYFASLAKRHFFFKGSREFGVDENLYDCVRRYFEMPVKAACRNVCADDWTKTLKDVKKIVIAPDSSNVAKSIDSADLKKLIKWLKGHFSKAMITIAVAEDDPSLEKEGVLRFIFKKSVSGSRAFLDLMEAADLVVAVDAGPLHLADALGKSVACIFGPTAPETILDKDSRVTALRSKKLDGVYCFVQTCKDPVCIHALFGKDGPGLAVEADFSRKIRIEETKCLMEPKGNAG